jgi:L-2-hydroxyglutarate oxidase LhgO
VRGLVTSEVMQHAFGSDQEVADITVVGAGIVGLAVAAELASQERTLVVLERNATYGLETSGHNSRVIHAGLYYPKGSLMARHCLEGNRRLYEYCRSRGVAYRRTGKLVVANTPDEERALLALYDRSQANGVPCVEMLSGREVAVREPLVRARAALLSGTTGIVDTASLMQALAADAENAGACVMCETTLLAVEPRAGGYFLVTRRAGEEYRFRTRALINCAGLEADVVASLAGIPVDVCGYRLKYCKGEYVEVRPSERTRFRHLIYPSRPDGARGLGIHVTIDVEGRVYLGPDATFLSRDAADYTVSGDRRAAFWDATRSFLPSLALDDLEPAFAGIRPKLSGPGEPQRDFVIAHEEQRGLPGFINLVGIESPGLTACLAIARHVRALMKDAALLD